MLSKDFMGGLHPTVWSAHTTLGPIVLCNDSDEFELGDEAQREILENWYRSLGGEEFARRVDLLVRGHVVDSPVCPMFKYRVASLAGSQKQMF